jgi:hypothetical protein
MNELFKKSTRLKPDIDFATLLSEEAKSELSKYYDTALSKRGRAFPKGDRAARLKHFVESIPSDVIERIDLATATRFSKDPHQQKYLTDAFRATVPETQAGLKRDDELQKLGLDMQNERLGRETQAGLKRDDELQKLGLDMQNQRLGREIQADLKRDDEQQKLGLDMQNQRLERETAQKMQSEEEEKTPQQTPINRGTFDPHARKDRQVATAKTKRQNNTRSNRVAAGGDVMSDVREPHKRKASQVDVNPTPAKVSLVSGDSTTTTLVPYKATPTALVPYKATQTALVPYKATHQTTDTSGFTSMIPGVMGSMFGTGGPSATSPSFSNGLGGVLVGGQSGSMLDKMIDSKFSESHRVMAGHIGNFVNAQGGAAGTEDRLLNFLSTLGGAKVQEAIMVFQNPEMLPQVAFQTLSDAGVFDRLGNAAEGFVKGLYDRVTGKKPPQMHAIGALPPALVPTTPSEQPVSPPPLALIFRDHDGSEIGGGFSNDTVMNSELADRPLLNPSNDSENRPETSLVKAGQNMVREGLGKVREQLGEMVGNAAQEAVINLGQAATENMPIPDSLRPKVDQMIKTGGKMVGDGVSARVVGGGGGTEKRESKDDEGTMTDDNDLPQLPIRDGAAESSTAVSSFRPRPILQPGRPGLASRKQPDARQVQPPPPSMGTAPVKRFSGKRVNHRNRQGPRHPPYARPAPVQSAGPADGGDDESKNDGGPPPSPSPTPPHQGIAGDDVLERFKRQTSQGDNAIPLRPEFKRAGVDSLKWPSNTQKMDKLQEASYYVPKHETRGTMYDNPLIRQNVLESALRFRNTNPMPTIRVPDVPRPSKSETQRVRRVLQSSYNSQQLKMNNNTATPVLMSTPMMNGLYERTSWSDVYVPMQIQAGGRPFTQAGVFNSLV